MVNRKKVSEVFTPRSSTVNADMYIPRKPLENSLYRSVEGTMHSFLFGESGNGKSWLYKKVFSDKKITYVVANCANASRRNSITDEIYSVCIDSGTATKTAYSETKKAGIKLLATAELSHQGEYEVLQEDTLIQSFRELNKKANKQKSIIVLDNVETIFENKALMGELSDVIILLDDERYAKFDIKFLIVGVPNQVIKYFSLSKNTPSVGNRIEEIHRVCGLEYTQVRDLVRHGLETQLKVKLSKNDLKELARHIYDITLGAPQRIHEYCEALAYLIEDNNWDYSKELLDRADNSWLVKGLRESYSIVDAFLNYDETSDGRRNQVMFALGVNELHQIHTTKIGNIVKQEFPNTSPDSNSGIGQVLAYLSKGDNPILKKVPKSNGYTLTDPRYLMCIRVMLHKNNETEKVSKKFFRIN